MAEVLCISCRPVDVPGKVEKQFSPLWRFCEARAILFKCQVRSRKKFSPLSRSCEALGGLFKCQELSRKQFSPLGSCCEARAGLFKCGKGPT